MKKSRFVVWVLLSYCLACSAFSQQLKVEEVLLPTNALKGISNLETDKGDLLWVASFANGQVGTTILTQTSASSGLTLVGRADGQFQKNGAGSTLNVPMSSFLPQSGDGNSFTVGSYIWAPGGMTGKDYESVVSKNPASVNQSCKDYAVAGVSLPASVNLVGPAFDSKGQKFYTGNDGVSSTIYLRGTANNGLCSLLPKGLVNGIVIKTVPLPDGGFLFEEVLSVNPLSFTRLTAQFGVLKNGVVSMLVSPNGTTNPRYLSASGGDLALDLVKQSAMISWLAKDGGKAVLYDMQTGAVEEIPLQPGMSTSYIEASSLRGAWAGIVVNGNSGWKILVYNRDTKNFWSAGSADTKLPGALEFVYLGTVTTRGTLFFTVLDSQFQDRLFKVDLLGVTGWLKPTVTFTADPMSVNPGEPVRLSWTSTNASFVNVNVPNDFATTGDYAVSGSKVFYPTSTTTVRAFARGPGGDSDTASVAITVKPLVPAPTFTAEAVVNAASFKAPISAGSLATIFGANLGSAIAQAGSLPLPTNLLGTQVLVNGKAAPLVYSSPDQINFQVPLEATGSSATIQVTTPQASSSVVTVPLSATPGIFTGEADNVIATNPAGNLIGTIANPATGEDVIVAYATGLGRTSCDIKTGEATPFTLCPTLETPVITIGGQQAEVLFSGLTPGFVGLYQVNFKVPGKRPADMSMTKGLPAVIVVSLNQLKSDDSAFIEIAQ